MTRDNVTVWTCDRCGSQVNTTGGDQPKGWLGVMFGVPPDADPQGSMWARKHLCKPCDTDFAKFVRPFSRGVIAEERETNR